MSTVSQSATVPPAFAGLVDDAAIFPPGNAAMADALALHPRHRASWYGDLVGPFVCSDTRLPELQQSRGAADSPLRVSLTITGGAGAIEPALTWVSGDDTLELAAVEIALRDEFDLAHNAARVVTVLSNAALSGVLPEDAEAFVELPRLHSPDVPAGWATALGEVAAAGHRLKYRTGGADADAFPSAAELATVIDAAIEREVEFKCTAGLHNAVAHAAVGTGFAHHGFLNVLLATRAALDGADRHGVEELLAGRDGRELAARVRETGDERLASARRWFRSIGSCSVTEPVEDLVALGLLADPTRDRRAHA